MVVRVVEFWGIEFVVGVLEVGFVYIAFYFWVFSVGIVLGFGGIVVIV